MKKNIVYLYTIEVEQGLYSEEKLGQKRFWEKSGEIRELFLWSPEICISESKSGNF